MKKTWAILAMLALVSKTLAYLTIPFPGWTALSDGSSDIIIARCSETPPETENGPDGIVYDRRDGLITTDIEVTFILKGATKWGNEKLEIPRLGKGKLLSEHWPRQGEFYAIFGILYDGSYQAKENYRVIPLGIEFPTNVLAGKSLDEQIKILLEYRRGELSRQMERDKEEMQRMDEGLRK